VVDGITSRRHQLHWVDLSTRIARTHAALLCADSASVGFFGMNDQTLAIGRFFWPEEDETSCERRGHVTRRLQWRLYRHADGWPERVIVDTVLSNVGKSSFEYVSYIRADEGHALLAEVTMTNVLVEFPTDAPTKSIHLRITARDREAIQNAYVVGSSHGIPAMPPGLHNLAPPPLAYRYRFVLRPSDCDSNRHLNNSVYVNLAYDAVGTALHDSYFDASVASLLGNAREPRLDAGEVLYAREIPIFSPGCSVLMWWVPRPEGNINVGGAICCHFCCEGLGAAPAATLVFVVLAEGQPPARL